MDSGLVLRLKPAITILEDRIGELGDSLAALAEAERGTVMLARTRGQQATPTSFGLKVAGWLAPLQRHLDRLEEFEYRLGVLIFVCPAGHPSAHGNDWPAGEAALAEPLDLAVVAMRWPVPR